MLVSTYLTVLHLLVSMGGYYVAAIRFAFEYIDDEEMDFANRMWIDEDSDFMQNIEAAATLWGEHIDSDELVDLWVFADSTVARSGGTFTNAYFLGSDNNGNSIFEPAPLSKVLTGTNPWGPPDIIVYINASYLDAEYWINPTSLDREDSMPPVGLTDFVSIMLHEIGHGLGIAGTKSHSPGAFYGTVPGYVNPFDVLSFFDGGNPDAALNDMGEPNPLFFNGTKASQIYGGPVPLAHVSPSAARSSQNFYHFGTCGSLPILTASLMNGCSVPNDGTVLEITPLDLAVLEDLGYPLTTPDPHPMLCFSGRQKVRVKGGAVVRMNDLHIGDEVLTGNNDYEPIYAFGHHDRTILATYLRFEPSGLELTAHHMVFVNANHRAIPAISVKIGDQLVVVMKYGNTSMQPAVTSIQKVLRRGAFAPFTRSGTLIVSNVQVSTFVAFQASETLTIRGVSTGLTYQWLARTALLPLSWRASTTRPDTPIIENQGILSCLVPPMEFAIWWVDQNYVVMALVAIPVILLCAIIATVELLLRNVVLAATGLIIIVGTYHSSIRTNALRPAKYP